METNLKEIMFNIPNIKNNDENELNTNQHFNSINKKRKDLEKERVKRSYNHQKSVAVDYKEKRKVIYNNSQNMLKKEIEQKFKRTDSFDNDEFNNILLNNDNYLNDTFGQSIEEKIVISIGEEKGKTFDLCKCKCIAF